jgi:hypothetical protein
MVGRAAGGGFGRDACFGGAGSCFELQPVKARLRRTMQIAS